MDGETVDYVTRNQLWGIRRLEGRQIVQGQPLDVFVDEEAHVANIIDTGNADELVLFTARAIERIHAIEDAAPINNEDGIEPIGGFGANIPLLPDFPDGCD